jgi:hypothetical protein
MAAEIQFPVWPAELPNAAVVQEDGQSFLVVKVPMQAPAPSASGKTLTVATTGFGKPTPAKYNGKTITVTMSANIPMR